MLVILVYSTQTLFNLDICFLYIGLVEIYFLRIIEYVPAFIYQNSGKVCKLRLCSPHFDDDVLVLFEQT